MAAPKVSVNLPCYNSAATLPVALDSLLAQTFQDFEIIAVDDGSKDQTADILREYARRDSRLRPLFIDHGGVSVAANAALEKSRGQYVARMDSDDQALPERLAAQAAHLDDRPEVGLVGCLARFGGDRESNGGYAHYVDWTNTLVDHESISLNRFVESPFANPTIMFRRDLAEVHGGYEHGDFPEDYDMILRWLEGGVRMEKVDRELMVWNDPPGRLTRNDPRYDVEAFYRVKTGYLARWLERNNALHPDVAVVGAGRITRKRADMLLDHGVNITTYFDIDPNKIDRVVHGRPVLHRREIPEPGRVFCLSYVASRGAREDIAELLDSRGHSMGRDYLLAG